MRLTLTAEMTVEIDKIKGSRFIGIARPCATAQEAELWSQELWERYSDARHVCWAHRGAHPDHVRYVDDGEPSGTAGKPILTVIEGLGLESTAVAVIRYFGGTKLGTGGLARAYSAATQAVLAASPIQELLLRAQVKITTAYSFESTLMYLLSQHNAEVLSRDYQAEVTVIAILTEAEADALCAQVIERTANRAQITRGDSYWG